MKPKTTTTNNNGNKHLEYYLFDKSRSRTIGKLVQLDYFIKMHL